MLPRGFHRIRHYGLFANGGRADNLARARELVGVAKPQTKPASTEPAAPDDASTLAQPCPCCGGRMIIIETFGPGATPRSQPTPPKPAIRIDTS